MSDPVAADNDIALVSAGHVFEAVEPVGPETRCEEVADLFERQPDLFAQPVVDAEGLPLGLLNRFRLLARLSRRFGRELLLRRAIIDCLDGPALLIDEQTPIEDVASQLFAGDRNHVLDGFIVTRDGRYLGVGTGVTLTRALSDLTIARAQRATERAGQANAAKSAFIANVSHEIRTPLNGVIGIAELLRHTPLTAEQQEMIELMHISGAALMALIDDVLDYSKIEASRFELERVPFDLRETVGEAVRILAVRANAKGLPIRLDVDAALPAKVVGDPARLRQVLLNLGGNAVKFTAQGQVRIGLRVMERSDASVQVEVRVEDTGIGIPRDQLGLLFRPFSQVAPASSIGFGGTGLGLSISQQIVGQMGGQIEAESEQGVGTAFSFRLALEVAAETVRSADPVEAGMAMAAVVTHAPGTRLTVLLAEDNPVNLLIATRLLQQLECTVEAVTDGGAAIRALAAGAYDLVLMDCQMPNVDGLEATRRIRNGEAGSEARAVPIIALTASATAENRQLCFDAGMDGYLTKPITPAVLKRELAERFQLATVRVG